MYQIKLSPYAKTFYYEWLLEPKGIHYNMVVDQTLHGSLQVERLRQALKRYIADHLVLNSHIEVIDKQPCWVVNDTIRPMRYENNSIDQEKLLDYVCQPFDLHTGSLYRFKLIRLANDHYRFVAVFHHSVLDGLSIKTGIIDAISHYYNNADYRCATTHTQQMQQLTVLTAQLEQKIKAQHDQDQRFWQKTLYDQPDAVDLRCLKTTYTSMSDPVSDHKTVSSVVRAIRWQQKGAAFERLSTLKKRYGLTRYVFSQCVLAALLYRYTGQSAFAITYPIAIREGFDFCYGAQVNTAIMPYHVTGDSKLGDIIKQTTTLLQATVRNSQHGYCPFATIDSISSAKAYLNVNMAATDVMVTPLAFDNIQTITINDTTSIDGVKGDGLLLEQQVIDNTLHYRLRYRPDYLDTAYVTPFVDAYKRLWEAMLYDLYQGELHKTLKKYSLLSPDVYQTMVYEWNQTDKAYPHNKTIHQLFETQVKQTPDAKAVIFEDQFLTYQALNQKANQLARYIRHLYQQQQGHALPPDTLIALCVQRSLDMIIAILAVLKAGGAYVPIDPDYPEQRIDYILKDTQSPLLLTQLALKKRLSTLLDKPARAKAQDVSPCLIALDDIDYNDYMISNLKPYNQAHDLAYVIYTSGTTGLPKGVVIEHRTLINRLMWMIDTYNFGQQDAILQKTPYIFDVSVWELLSPLLCGARLVIAKPKAHKEATYLHQIIKEQGITRIHFVPSMLQQYLDNNTVNNQGNETPSLRDVFCSGEVLSKKTTIQFKNFFKKVALHNLYGPTETCIDSSSYNHITGYESLVSIGKPIDNTQCYVVDSYLQPVSLGAIGELCIAGAGLARGYLNQPKLTNKCFIDNPFVNDQEKKQRYTRLYKTGDLVRWLPDGNIEYVGRHDQQVKLRGFRIELGEIEQVLSSHSAVKQAVVLVKETNKKKSPIAHSLVAYYTADQALKNQILEVYLSHYLPDYMIPNVFVHLDSLPLTINGKLDKKALPDPIYSSQTYYVPPTTALEASLCQLWQTLLGHDRIGIEDDFFTLGGHSILAIQLAQRISEQTDKQISPADVLRYRTIRQLAAQVANQSSQKTVIPITQTMDAPLSYAQERLWFIEYYEQGTQAYHIPLLLELDRHASAALFKQALVAIIERHSVLRTMIQQNQEGQYRQWISHDLNLFIYDELAFGSDQDFQQTLQAAIRQPFDLQHGFPIRAHAFTVDTLDKTAYDTKKHYLLLTVHHIAFDGWSIPLFLRELHLHYKALLHKETINLPPLPLQYKDFAYWQKCDLKGEKLKKQLDYWQKTLANSEPLAFPTDYARPAAVNYKGRSLNFTFDQATTSTLKAFAQQKGYTLYTVLLASFYLLLYHYTGQTRIIVGTPIANRQHHQLDPLIGFFVNTLAIAQDLSPKQTRDAFMQQLQHTLVTMQSYQDCPFEKLVDALNSDHDQSRHPLFQVLFSLNHFENPSSPYFKTMPVKETVAKFDISLVFTDHGDTICGEWNYATALFKESTIEYIVKHYQYLIQQWLECDNRPLGQYRTLTPDAYQTIVYDWNRTDKAYPQDKTIHQLFEEQVKKTPDAKAVVFEDQFLSYQALNHKANQLARCIRRLYQQQQDHTLPPNTLIALCLQRSLDMIIAILAVLKAGGAYVPIDPDYPKQRIGYILRDTQSPLLLTQLTLKKRLSTLLDKSEKEQAVSPRLIVLDDINYNHYAKDNLKPYSQSHHLAYVMYTSGTTGVPKGVMVEHKNIAHFAIGNRFIDHDAIRVIAGISNYAFDGSLFDIFVALLNGKMLVLLHTLHNLSNEQWNHIILKYNIDTVFITTALFNVFTLNKLSSLGKLKQLLFGGQLANLPIIKQFRATYQHVRLLHVYGPTETTIYAIFCDLSHYPTNNSPIGCGISNTKLYVLGNNLNPTPLGVIGELYIAGAGLARGYLNQPTLTAECFVDNPFASHSDKVKGYTRLYKTGDLVRWLADGTIEYIGRCDQQVKLRGFRVELGEIEQILCRYSGIQQAVVLAKTHDKTDDPYLVAYYVNDKAISESNLTDHLRDYLPHYMIPNQLIRINHLPLTINGKLDRKALPEPQYTEAISYVAPSNELEKALCTLWQTVLGVKRVGINNDFFRLGGHSILAIKLLHRIEKERGLRFSLKQLFSARTVQRLAVLPEACAAQDNDSRSVASLAPKAVLDDAIRACGKPAPKKPKRFLLTGATGFVGAFILSALLSEQSEHHVYCLVRSTKQATAKQRLHKTLRQYGLELPWLRITVIDGDLTKPYLGLSLGAFNALADQIDSIIHNGAWVNFLHDYDTLATANVLGTQETLRLACQKRDLPYHYISTLGIFHHYKDNSESAVIREDTRLSQDDLLYGGYTQSKWVGEQLVECAKARGMATNIIRLGRVFPHSQSGVYHRDDVMMRLIETCYRLQLAPKLAIKLDWMPVDYTATAIAQIASLPILAEQPLHLVQTHPLAWKMLIEWLNQASHTIQTVPVDQWLNKVRQQENVHPTPISALLNHSQQPEKQLDQLDVQRCYNTNYTVNTLKNNTLRCPLPQPSFIAYYAQQWAKTFGRSRKISSIIKSLPISLNQQLYADDSGKQPQRTVNTTLEQSVIDKKGMHYEYNPQGRALYDKRLPIAS